MGRPKPLRSVQRQFWLLVAQGVTTAAACEALDVSERAGNLWFRDADTEKCQGTGFPIESRP